MGGGLGTKRCARVLHRGCPCPCLSPKPGKGGEQKEGSEVGVLEALNMIGRVQREREDTLEGERERERRERKIRVQT